MSTPIRTAVLGYGLAGRVFHCPFVSAVPGLELTAIVQRRGDEAHAAYPQARILRSADEAFADPSIDLIVVGTPNITHTELATAALKADKHVVVDKPLAPTSSEARTLIELATNQGRILAPFHNRRFDGDFLTVKKLLAEGTIGRVAEIVSRFDRFRPIKRPNSWKEEGGQFSGVLYDLGPHLFDQAVALFGVPDRITATVRHDRDNTDVDDAFVATLDYDNVRLNGQPTGHALHYECRATMLGAAPQPRFIVNGTNGSYVKRGVDPQEPAILNTPARPPRMDSPDPWLPEPEAAWGTLTICTQQQEPVQVHSTQFQTETGDYRRFYANVRDAILGKAELAIPSEAGFINLRLLELAAESHKQRRTLDVTL